MSESKRALEVAVRAARAGGRILKRRMAGLRRSQFSKKGPCDWVTEVDKESERAILKVLRKAFPDHSIKAEESSPAEAAQPRQWLIDPLDGTVNYMHRFPMFCVSIGFVERGKLEAGVVYDPTREELFTARRGQGAFLNGRRIRVASCSAFDESLVATGFPFRAKDKMDLYIGSFRKVFLKTGSIRRAGSAALDLAYVACGRMDGFWEMALQPWDMAAGALLVQEAGGRVTDLFGRREFLEWGHVLAGNRPIHRRLLRLLAPYFRGKIVPCLIEK